MSYALEYCPRTGNLRIQKLDEIISHNQKCFFKDEAIEFFPIATGATLNEVELMKTALLETKEQLRKQLF